MCLKMPKQPRNIYLGQIKTNDCKAATTPDRYFIFDVVYIIFLEF